MVSATDDCDHMLVAHISGDRRAGNSLCETLYPAVKGVISRAAKDLVVKDLVFDAAQETFRILFANPARFDPARGALRNFVLNALTKEAITAVRAQHAPPGRRTRHQRSKSDEEPRHKYFDTTVPTLERVADLKASDQGRGAAVAEAACDVNRVIRLAGPTLAKALAAIADGRSTTEAALEIGLTRFQLRRRLMAFRAEVGIAA